MWIKARVRVILPGFALIVLSSVVLVQLPAGANEQVLKPFGGALFRDGQHPQAALVQGLDGALYGTSLAGGTNNAGTVFKINLDGSGYLVLHEFGGANDGAQPSAALVRGAEGALYGTTSKAGTNGGTIFKINEDGSGYATLYTFPGPPSYAASFPSFSSLTLGSEGNLYGTIITGTESAAIFKLSPDGTGFQVLHALPNQFGQQIPGALLQAADGMFYGTTPLGGARHAGTLFKINSDGTGYLELYEFGATTNDAVMPESALVQGGDGTLYGTTVAGGTYGFGTIFQIKPDGSGYQVLLSIRSPQYGYALQGGLCFGQDGWLYGAFPGGGSAPGQIFRFNPTLTNYEVLYDFSINPARQDGAHPQAALLLANNGLLYGTTYDGGTNNVGTVFQGKTDGTGFGLLHSFGTVFFDGANPLGGLVQGLDGALYGTTQRGGTNGLGTAFKLGPDGTGYLVLHAFFGGTDGAQPSAGLALGSDNSLYGVTSMGGTSNAGTLFRLDADGSNYRVLHNFGLLSADGIFPSARLVVGPDGGLYGTTFAGGISNLGTIFRMDQSGTSYRVLRSFTGGFSDGANPGSSLVQGVDGNLYGVTPRGGQYDAGTLFRIATNGTGFVLLKNFPDTPQNLTRAAAGGFYGTTASGVFGVLSDGTAFRVLYSFDWNPLVGYYLSGALVQGSDGTLYGTTRKGPNDGPGMAFSLQPDGTGFTVLHGFGSSLSDGRYPQGPLVVGADGALYGVTQGGGSGAGTVFRLTLVQYVPPPPFLLSIVPAGGGSLRVSCEGVLGLTYVLQTSTDLASWSSVGTVSNESGSVDFLQWNAASSPQRFYRLLQMH